jgi:hypothetical protein
MTFAARAPSGLSSGSNVAAVRVATGSPVSADGSADPPSATDAAYPPGPGASVVPLDCSELATVWVACEMSNAGTQLAQGAGSILLDPLWRDPGAADGFRWKRPNFGPDPGMTSAPTKVKLDAGGWWIELRVDGALVFPRIDAVTGVADTVVVLARPGQPRISNRKFQ